MRTLTPSQQSAVLYLDGDSSILAGAGSGKTLVLVEKVALLVEKFHVPLEKILVVTFTEKAAAEIKERIARRLRMDVRDLDPLPVGTIHAMAATLLRRFGTPLENQPDQHRRCVEGEAPTALPVEGATRAPTIDFRIMDDFLAGLERVRASREGFLERINLRDPEAIEAVDHLGLHRGIRLFVDLLSRRQSPASYTTVLSQIREKYRSRKRSLNLLDFDDLETLTLELLSDEGRRKTLQACFDWIIVDEFQDVSPIQWQVLSLLHHPPAGRLAIVGDPRQSIYRFRGADPSLFWKVSREIEGRGGKGFDLSDNFRSLPAVIEFVNRTSGTLFSQTFPPLKTQRNESSGSVDFLRLDPSTLKETREAEAAAVAAHLQQLRSQGILWKSMALLFRTRRAVPSYEAAFRERKIPYVTSLGEPLLERPEVVTLLFLMRRCAGLTGPAKDLVETGLGQSALASFTEELPTDLLPAFLDTLFEKATPLFPKKVHRNLAAFRDLLANLMTLGNHDLKGLLDNLHALREEEARITCPTEREEGEDAVTFMTVHASKGLEFPIVVICDLAARLTLGSAAGGIYVDSARGEIVLKEKEATAPGLKDRLVKGERFSEIEADNRNEEIEESKRLLYVALTRARDRLILPLPLTDKGTLHVEKRSKKRESWSEWLQP